ncbi:helix-turn-helix domain-containing protein [Nocardia sp. BSTN01]|uniref:helix-turn-helix transcriptional regulator n=1 Tax=Nocardia sp. BSTN01 TaxID=2783665 RepID=UPI00189001F8|nr:helix-turn-helix transcriptional regulator [Nocardia sp. BSTN01]MBF4997311.1 helix-turn-helix domain-containing protein [Nocardia sp. BSTN01]
MSAADSKQRRLELAAFLRAKRAAAPVPSSDTSSPKRRVPGLRREEVAHLAGVSYTWYTRLEQGRDVRPTAQVVDAVARALGLDEVSHRHLRRLADLPLGDRAEAADSVGEDVLMLLEHLLPAPAVVLNSRFDYVAWNDAHSTLFCDASRLPTDRRNALWATFMVPAVRESLVDWDEQARSVIAQFRAEAALRPADGRSDELVAELISHSPEFACWWAAHEVRRGDARSCVFRHPQAGEVRTRLVQLRLVAQPWFKLVTHLPEGEGTVDRLRALQGSEIWTARVAGRQPLESSPASETPPPR